MKLSDRGILEIAEHEGIVPAPYRDSQGVWTFGIGHTAAAGGLDPQEMARAMPEGDALERAIDRAIAVFREDVVKYEARVRQAIAGAPKPLAQHQVDALVSWDFNTGGATWRSSSGEPARLIRQVHAGDLSGEGFMGWLRPPEIRKRRTAEMRLFQTGDYDANGDLIPVWKTNGRGKLITVLRTVNGTELLERMGRTRPAEDPVPSEPAGNGWAALWAMIRKLLGG